MSVHTKQQENSKQRQKKWVGGGYTPKFFGNSLVLSIHKLSYTWNVFLNKSQIFLIKANTKKIIIIHSSSP